MMHAIRELYLFRDNLIKHALSKDLLTKFFASLWAFFREIPTGILSLALRLSDHWAKQANR